MNELELKEEQRRFVDSTLASYDENIALAKEIDRLKKELKQTKLNFKNSQTHSKNSYKKLKEKYEKLERAYKNNEVMVRDLNELITRNLELKTELNRCQETISAWMENHKQLIIDNGKLKKENQGVKDDNTRLWHGIEYANNEIAKLRKSIEILKDNFEIVICKSDFPISELKYSIGFKINNDGVWAHIPQEDCELLEEVFNYE